MPEEPADIEKLIKNVGGLGHDIRELDFNKEMGDAMEDAAGAAADALRYADRKECSLGDSAHHFALFRIAERTALAAMDLSHNEDAVKNYLEGARAVASLRRALAREVADRFAKNCGCKIES